MTAKKLPQAVPPANANSSLKPNSRQRILVVEDDAVIRRLNVEVLTYLGYHVDSAEDGAVAWEALQRHNYDLMITDNGTPRLTGVELIEKLQTARIATPVIMATGILPDEQFIRYKLLQPAKTLLKPYTVLELLAAVEQILYPTNTWLEEIAPPSNWQVQPRAESFAVRHSNLASPLNCP
jgi:DNA-binding response OmpR family regulator